MNPTLRLLQQWSRLLTGIAAAAALSACHADGHCRCGRDGADHQQHDGQPMPQQQMQQQQHDGQMQQQQHDGQMPQQQMPQQQMQQQHDGQMPPPDQRMHGAPPGQHAWMDGGPPDGPRERRDPQGRPPHDGGGDWQVPGQPRDPQARDGHPGGPPGGDPRQHGGHGGEGRDQEFAERDRERTLNDRLHRELFERLDRLQQRLQVLQQRLDELLRTRTRR